MSDKTPEQQNAEFVSAVLFNPESVLTSTIEWFAANLDPQEVFDRAQLEAWAKMNGWTPPQET